MTHAADRPFRAALPIALLLLGARLALTGPVGLVMAAMYFISGSLWLPMLAHAAVDHFSGRMAFDAINAPGEPAPEDRYDSSDVAAARSAAA